MIKIRKVFIAFILTTSIFYSKKNVAQTLKDAIKLTDNEQFGKASQLYRNLIQKEPQNGDNFFYLGDNYFKSDDLDSAKICFQKGADLNASNPINYVGLGKVNWFQGNMVDAKANFYKAITLSQSKNAVVLFKMAEAYIKADKKDLKEAVNLLAQAEKLDARNPEIYILKGDAFLEQNDGSQAIANYEKATELNKSSVKAILRIGQLYGRAKNYNLALEYYQNANKVDSSFAPAYREKAELLYKAGQVDRAIEQYKKYLAINNDLTARTRYASFLFVGNDYKKVIAEIKTIQLSDTNNANLYRFLAYSYFETGDYPSGISSIQKFFAKAKPANIKIIASDYAYYGKLLSKSGNDSLAINQLNKALEIDTTQKELNGEIANIYFKLKQYPQAIESYNKKIAAGKGITPNDYLSLGRAYYFGPKDYIKADSAFVQITRSNPSLPTGYQWRAKSYTAMDPDSKLGLAKPYYEQYIEKAEIDKEKYKKDLIEAYSYLGYYYALRKDSENAKLYWTKVKELDPENAKQKAYFNSAK